MNNYIFQNVSINAVEFINNKNDIKFSFNNTTTSNWEHCGDLTCIDILSLKMQTYLQDDPDPYFPQFICDVSVDACPNNNNYKSVALQGGSYEFFITCKQAVVLKVTS